MNAQSDFYGTFIPTDDLRAFAQPQPHHAVGELAASEAGRFRAICADLLTYRSQDPASITPELVPNHILIEFARAPGALTAIETAVACMYFSDICGELLAHRLLAEAEGRA